MIALPERAFRRLSSLALAEAGLDLSEGKQSFVAARLQKRLRATGAQDFEVYAALVEGTGPAATEERQKLISALTTNVTSFFREPHHFTLLARALKALDRGPSTPLRMWSAGCSTGEETLSMAMVCRSVFGREWTARARILATDIDVASLSVAQQRGDDSEANVELREAAQAALGPTRVCPNVTVAELHSGVTYLRHSLIDPLSVSRPFDVIFCRNVTIYFAPKIQRSVQADLIQRLAPDGLLCLGHSERLLVDQAGLRLVGQTSYAGASASFAEAVRCR